MAITKEYLLEEIKQIEDAIKSIALQNSSTDEVDAAAIDTLRARIEILKLALAGLEIRGMCGQVQRKSP